MRAELGIWISVILLGAATTFGLILGFIPGGAVLFAVVGLIVANRIGHSVSVDDDRAWLAPMLTLAYLARLVGAVVHHYFVTVVYQSGDSLAYHRVAANMVGDWRAFQVPVAPGGSAGTRFVEHVTSLFYVPAVPSLLIGFLVFTSLGFMGTVALYLAFRRSFPAGALRRYALILFFLPSMLFWPSTIGKEGLMMLAIGVTSLGAARLFVGGRRGSLVVFGLGVAGMAAVRPHVAVMLVAAFVVALVLSRRMGAHLSPLSRVLVAGLTLAALWGLTSLAMTRLGLEDGTESIEEFLVEQEQHTAQGGSAVVGSPVRNPLDLPEATLRVLFRPLPHEAHNMQAALSALEGAALLALVIWRLPTMLRRSRLLWRRPYLLYSLIFMAEFVVAFSSILNLGILARQRTQVLPFLLALVVGLGWEYSQEETRPTRQTLEPV